MAIETFRVFINATPEQIFPFVGDLPRHSEWATDPMQFETLTPYAVGEGSQYRSSVHFMGMIVTAELKVKEYVPPERFTFTVKDRTGQYEHIFTLKPQGEGTLVSREVHSVDTPFSKIVHAILLPILIKPEANKAFRNLKDKVEREYHKLVNSPGRVET